MASINQFATVGRRKTSTARVYLRPGTGQILINRRSMEAYFKLETCRTTLLSPLEITGTRGEFDLVVNVKGGGITGQSEAIRLGIARALVQSSDDHRKPLRDAGLLTRDPRMVERKKYGQPKARKRFQFSKR